MGDDLEEGILQFPSRERRTVVSMSMPRYLYDKHTRAAEEAGIDFDDYISQGLEMMHFFQNGIRKGNDPVLYMGNQDVDDPEKLILDSSLKYR